MNRPAGSHHPRLAVDPSIAAQSPSKLFDFSTGVIIMKRGGVVKGVVLPRPGRRAVPLKMLRSFY